MQTSERHTIRVNLNGRDVEADVAGNLLLSEFLRREQNLTGTHVGCDTSECGACVVLLDDRSVKSCTMLAVQANGCRLTTIEGLAADDGTLHPMQQAFQDEHGLQCGFCTPGVVMSAIELARQAPEADEEQVRHWLEGHICRCTGYTNIVRAIRAGAAGMQR